MTGNLARRNREAVENARERRQEERSDARRRLLMMPRTDGLSPLPAPYITQVLDTLFPEIDVEEEN